MASMASEETRGIAGHLICLGDMLNERNRRQQGEGNFDDGFQHNRNIVVSSVVSGILLGISVGMLSLKLILQLKPKLIIW